MATRTRYANLGSFGVALLLLALVTGTAAAQNGGVRVLMIEYTYEPKTVTIVAGSTVTWHNAGREAHTATLAGVFDTGSVAPGSDATVTFDHPGTYVYACRFHGGPTGAGMNGTVVVTEAPPAKGIPGGPALPPAGAPSSPLVALSLAAVALSLAGFSLRALR